MIATLDTNILVSAAAFGGTPRVVVEAAARGRFTIAISTEILEEYRSVLIRTKFKIDKQRAEILVREIQELARLVFPSRRVNLVEDDPDDDAILECAVESESDYIVSGDRHLLQIGRFEGIVILSARDFLSELEHEVAT